MAKDKYDINVRSEEIQDLMVKKPSWMIRWGITAILVIIFLLLMFTWIMKYPDIIYGRVNITVDQPPVKIVNQSNGKITHLLLKDATKVESGAIIAEIENPVSAEIVSYLEMYVENLDSVIYSGAQNLPLPDTGNRKYGDLQIRMNEMRKDLSLYNLKMIHDLELQEIIKLQERIAYHKEMIVISENLEGIEKQELDNAKEKYIADQKMYLDSVLSKYDFMQSETQYHKSQQQYDQLLLNIVQFKLTLNSMEMELANKRYNRDQNLQTDLQKILSHREFIVNFINIWKQKFALIAPVGGYLTYLSPIYENQYIYEGESYFAIIQDNHDIVGWMEVPSTGYGKINIGQKVNVRLDNYPFHEFGILEGTVIRMGQIPEKNVYSVEVAFPEGLMTTYHHELKFSPEMLGSAEIITENKRLLQRIFDSFIKLINRGHHTSNVT